MKRKFLEDLGIEKDAIDKIMEENGKDIEKAKGDFEDVKIELNTAKKTITDRDAEIKKLQESNGDNALLQDTIKAHEATIANLKAEADKTSKTYALKEQLSKAGVIDPDYLIYKQGGVDKFKFDKDGKAEGIEDMLKSYREDKSMAHLFNQPVYKPKGGIGDGNENPFEKETFNLTKQGELFKSNPVQAREMAAAVGINI